MDLTWNIDNIYKSFTCNEFLNDIDKLERYIDKINRINIDEWDKNEKVSENIKSFLELENEYELLYQKLLSYSFLRSCVNVNDAEADNKICYIENKNSEHKKAIIAFSRWLEGVKDLDSVINSNKYILDHKFYLNELKQKGKYLLNEKEEVIISKMQNIGSKAWQSYYMELVSEGTEKLIINGKEEFFTLSELCSLVYDYRMDVRKDAFNRQIDLCKKLSRASAKCINGIAGEANLICEMRGYKSPLDRSLIESRMDVETLNCMTKAIEENLEVFRKYFKKKAEILKYKTSLPFYDCYATLGKTDKVVSYEECREIIVSAFNSFSKKLGDFADKAFNEKWIDAEPRREKGDFGVSEDIFSLKESRISVNYNGNITDVGVLAHEIGHAYHSSNIFNETILNSKYGVPVAETASIFCEILLNENMMQTCSNSEKLIILEKSISDASYFIMEFYVRFLFEKELYERRKEGTLSVDELNQMMVKYMKKVYRDSIDEKTINPYMWLNRPGYFMPVNNFLNFPYSFGVLFAKGLYADYLKRGNDFVKEYDNFLRNTSRNNIFDVAKLMNININDIDFWRNSFKLIEKDIEELVNLI